MNPKEAILIAMLKAGPKTEIDGGANEIIDALGALGFIIAPIQPTAVMIDAPEGNTLIADEVWSAMIRAWSCETQQ